MLITHISIIMNRGILNHWLINSNIVKKMIKNTNEDRTLIFKKVEKVTFSQRVITTMKTRVETVVTKVCEKNLNKMQKLIIYRHN